MFGANRHRGISPQRGNNDAMFTLKPPVPEPVLIDGESRLAGR